MGFARRRLRENPSECCGWLSALNPRREKHEREANKRYDSGQPNRVSPIVQRLGCRMCSLCSAGPKGGWIRRGILNRVPRERRGGLKIFGGRRSDLRRKSAHKAICC
jgi:hypothetical protein